MATTKKGVAGGLATLDTSAKLPSAQLPTGMGAQAAAVTDQGALTASAAAALTSSTPAALTSAAATGGDSPTEAEYNALRTDVSNLRTTVAAIVVDITAIRTAANAAITDLGTARTKLNDLLASLRTAELLDT